MKRHGLQADAGVKTGPFDVVSCVVFDGREYSGEVYGVHLAICIQCDDDVYSLSDCFSKTRDKRGSYTPSAFVVE